MQGKERHTRQAHGSELSGALQPGREKAKGKWFCQGSSDCADLSNSGVRQAENKKNSKIGRGPGDLSQIIFLYASALAAVVHISMLLHHQASGTLRKTFSPACKIGVRV